MRLEFRRTQLSSDGGLLIIRELDDASGCPICRDAARSQSSARPQASRHPRTCSGYHESLANLTPADVYLGSRPIDFMLLAWFRLRKET